MTVHGGTRIFLLQLCDEIAESNLLRRGTCVLRRFAVSSAAADIADTDRASVLPGAMSAGHFLGTPTVYRAVA